MQKNRNATEEYNIQASKEQAGKDAQIRLNNFIENLELAQSFGQIEETKENKKEKIQKILCHCIVLTFDHAFYCGNALFAALI